VTLTLGQPLTVEDRLDLASPYASRKQIQSIAMCKRAKHSFWVGAVGSGKTIASLTAFLIAIAEAPPGLIVIVGNTKQSIERNILGPLQNPALFGEISKLVTHTRGSEVAIILGRQIEIIGAPNVTAEDRIRGSSIVLAYVDEAILLPEGFFRMLLTRLRVIVDGVNVSRLLATTNPGSKNHWLRKEYLIRPTETSTITFYFTQDDNPVLPEADKALNRSMYSGLFYERMILGKWTNATGAIYEQFDESKHTIAWDQMPTFTEILAVGIDHGTTNPTSATMIGVTDEHDPETGRRAPRLVMLDEWRWDPAVQNQKLTNVEQSARVRTWIRRMHTPGVEVLSPRFVYVDPAAADFREQLKRDHLTNWAADNAVSEGIADVSSLLTQGRLLIARPKGPDLPGCAGILEEVTEYRWDPKATEKGEDAPIKKADHSMDAMRYAVRSSKPQWSAIFRKAYGLAA
jgi:PBSX family phage terminase large subunit